MENKKLTPAMLYKCLTHVNPEIRERAWKRYWKDYFSGTPILRLTRSKYGDHGYCAEEYFKYLLEALPAYPHQDPKAIALFIDVLKEDSHINMILDILLQATVKTAQAELITELKQYLEIPVYALLIDLPAAKILSSAFRVPLKSLYEELTNLTLQRLQNGIGLIDVYKLLEKQHDNLNTFDFLFRLNKSLMENNIDIPDYCIELFDKVLTDTEKEPKLYEQAKEACEDFIKQSIRKGDRNKLMLVLNRKNSFINNGTITDASRIHWLQLIIEEQGNQPAPAANPHYVINILPVLLKVTLNDVKNAEHCVPLYQKLVKDIHFMRKEKLCNDLQRILLMLVHCRNHYSVPYSEDHKNMVWEGSSYQPFTPLFPDVNEKYAEMMLQLLVNNPEKAGLQNLLNAFCMGGSFQRSLLDLRVLGPQIIEQLIANENIVKMVLPACQTKKNIYVLHALKQYRFTETACIGEIVTQLYKLFYIAGHCDVKKTIIDILLNIFTQRRATLSKSELKLIADTCNSMTDVNLSAYEELQKIAEFRKNEKMKLYDLLESF